MKSQVLSRHPLVPLALTLLSVFALLWASRVQADDRSLVKVQEADPYVFILFDTTGSMNWPTTGFNDAVPAQDGPQSRMFQAKQAIYNVLENVQNVKFGFATFPNHNQLRVRGKTPCNFPTSNTACITRDNTWFGAGVCDGWEPNTDEANDPFTPTDPATGSDLQTINLKYPTVSNPYESGLPAVMDHGDVIPMHWDHSNARLIQRRLAPNLNLDGDNDGTAAWDDADDPQATPYFGVAPFLEDFPLLGDPLDPVNRALDVSNSVALPILGRGATPLAASVRNFNAHIKDWIVEAKKNDPRFGCKKVYLIILTDGEDTCLPANGDGPADDPNPRETQPPLAVKEVYDDNDVKTWVVGYAVNNTTILNNMAIEGQTDARTVDPTATNQAFFPSNQTELVNAFRNIFNAIRAEAQSFASAAVPQNQANSADKIYLSSFFPVEGAAVWPGRIDAYLRPLPLRNEVVTLPDGTTETRQVPDRTKNCTASDRSACRLWDGGDQLLLQGADTTQLDNREYNIGNGEGRRRVYYTGRSNAGAPRRRAFLPNTLTDGRAQELMGLMGCGTAGSVFPDCTASTSNLDELHKVARYVHETKSYEDPDAPAVMINYLLGEIFHSDPVVVGAPDNFRFYANDLFADFHGPSETRPTAALLSQGFDEACEINSPYTKENPGYICFFERHKFRRKVLFVGANDGQLHAFDAGIFDGNFNNTTGVVTGNFDNGTGRELFSFIPEGVLPTLTEMANGTLETYGMDGSVTVADVFTGPTATDKRWRTVAIGGLREGGKGYFALDITQPDVLGNGNIPQPRTGSLKYVQSCVSSSTTGCIDQYPRILWEFQDQCENTITNALEPCDEDANGLDDLGDGWSKPTVGLIRVCDGSNCGPTGTDITERFVAIFGGGIDPDNLGARGNFIYMVDVETGQTIYKREVIGAVPSEPAAVDTDQDGLIDTIYVGTTSGYMYKVDMRTVPQLVNVSGLGKRITDVAWSPFQIFDAGPRPIFFPPSVIFVGKLGRYAVAFGTGYREDLWGPRTETARFFVVLDEILDSTSTPARRRPFERGDTGLPLTSTDLRQINPDSLPASGEPDYLSAPGTFDPGWYMELLSREKVIASPFGLSGLLVFLTFQPEEIINGGSRTCARRGQGRSFTVLTTNGNPVVGNSRYTIIDDLPTGAYTELGITKNPDPNASPGSVEEAIPPDLVSVMDSLKGLFPDDCKFANYTINVKTRRADTGVEFIAPVPICIVEKNWKEF
ncbi:MAG: PilC/PilY family type IV pilus protein [Acidobacteriota bacterium]